MAPLASNSPFNDTPTAREIPNQLSPPTTMCLDTQPPRDDAGEGAAAPAGRQRTSPGYSAAEATASFAASRAAALTRDPAATLNHESPAATVYAAALDVSQTRGEYADPASTPGVDARRLDVTPARATRPNRPRRSTDMRGDFEVMRCVVFM